MTEQHEIKKREKFKVLLLYPNLSMVFSPPLSMAIFTSILKKEQYIVDIFDVTPYVGEGCSAPAESDGVQVDEMNSMRVHDGDEQLTFQSASTEESMQDLMQSRSFSYEDDLKIEKKLGLFGDFTQKIFSFKPDLILCSVVEDTFFQAVKLLSLIADQKIPCLMGGVFTTASPELALSYENVDMVAIGEGERIIVEVAERIRKKIPCDDVEGVWVKKENGEIIKNKRGPLVDFRDIIPDYSLFEDARFYRQMGGSTFKSLAIESYRGCPYTCAYCNSPMQATLAKDSGLGKFVRRRQFDAYRDYLNKVIEENQPTYFMFTDDSFLARPKREIEDFCEMYEEFKIPFWFNTRPENVTVENLAMLKNVNCHRMSFGLECGNEEFRAKVLLRKIANNKLVDKFFIIAEGGIPFSMNNIIGFPGETRQLIFETIELNRQIPAYDALTVNIFTPYHGTVLREICVKEGYIDQNLIVSDMLGTNLSMPQISENELKALLKTFPLYVHFDKSEWKDIALAESNSTEGKRVFEEYRDRYLEEAFSLNQDEKMAKYKKSDNWAFQSGLVS